MFRSTCQIGSYGAEQTERSGLLPIRLSKSERMKAAEDRLKISSMPVGMEVMQLLLRQRKDEGPCGRVEGPAGDVREVCETLDVFNTACPFHRCCSGHGELIDTVQTLAAPQSKRHLDISGGASQRSYTMSGRPAETRSGLQSGHSPTCSAVTYSDVESNDMEECNID
jgi:hypothetical protein